MPSTTIPSTLNPEERTCPRLSIMENVHHFTNVWSVLLTLCIVIQLPGTSLHSHIAPWNSIILKCSAQMSLSALSPDSHSETNSSLFYPARVDFFCVIFHILHCIAISSICIFFFKFWYLTSFRVEVRAHLYFVSHRIPRNIRSSMTGSWIEQ